MPGFSLIYDTSPALELRRPALDRALEIACHNSRYTHSLITANPHCLLGWSAYPEYPSTTITTDHAILLVDGVFYDHTTDELEDCVRSVDGNPDRCDRIAAWLAKRLPGCDADCVVVYVERTPAGGAVIANDALGRLPVYWTQEESRLFIGREIKTFTSLVDTLRPDRVGIAQSLLIGYPLGPRTLLEGVRRLEPGHMMRLNGASRKVSVESFHTWVLDSAPDGPGPTAADTVPAVTAFQEACTHRLKRFPERPVVLLLSGGMDSRAVAGGMSRAGRPFEALTFHDEHDYPEVECEVAEEVAAYLRIPIRRLVLQEPLPWDHQWAIELRDGLNFAMLAYQRQIYAHLIRTWGSNTLVITGDGGGQLMPYHHPMRPLRSERDLARYMVSHTASTDLGTVCRMVGIERRRIWESICSHIGTYPEKRLEDKYYRFTVFGRGWKWLFEGEERNRSQMWFATPFYSPAFFAAAMAVPPAWRKSNLWFREFLRALAPRLAEITVANTGQPPGIMPRRSGEFFKRLLERTPRIDVWARERHRRRNLYHRPARTRWSPGYPEECGHSALVQEAFDVATLRRLCSRPLNERLYWQVTTMLWYLRRTDELRDLRQEMPASPSPVSEAIRRPAR